MRVEVRLGGQADVASVASLARKAFVDAYSAVVSLGELDEYVDEAFSPRRIAAELGEPGSAFLLAETDRIQVGYARLAISTAPELVSAARPLELVRIYVAS